MIGFVAAIDEDEEMVVHEQVLSAPSLERPLGSCRARECQWLISLTAALHSLHVKFRIASYLPSSTKSIQGFGLTYWSSSMWTCGCNPGI